MDDLFQFFDCYYCSLRNREVGPNVLREVRSTADSLALFGGLRLGRTRFARPFVGAREPGLRRRRNSSPWLLLASRNRWRTGHHRPGREKPDRNLSMIWDYFITGGREGGRDSIPWKRGEVLLTARKMIPVRNFIDEKSWRLLFLVELLALVEDKPKSPSGCDWFLSASFRLEKAFIGCEMRANQYSIRGLLARQLRGVGCFSLDPNS